jgi:hypothetical protein
MKFKSWLESFESHPLDDEIFDAVWDGFQKNGSPDQIFQDVNSRLADQILQLDPVNQRTARTAIISHIMHQVFEKLNDVRPRMLAPQIYQTAMAQGSNLLLMLTPQEREAIMPSVNLQRTLGDMFGPHDQEDVDNLDHLGDAIRRVSGQNKEDPPDQGEYGMGGNWWNK